MRFLSHSGEEFLIAHFNGAGVGQYWPAIVAFQKAAISLPRNITILTFASRYLNGHTLDRTPLLIEQLRAADIPYLNPAADIIVWQNPMKIGLICSAAEHIASEYLLVLDAADVMLTGPLDNLIDRWATYDKKLVFGATKNNFPDVLIDQVRDRDFMGEFRYLNAGTLFGRTADVLAFYRRASELEQEIGNPFNSEQFIVRCTFAEDTENVAFDYQCRLFQTFNKALIQQDGDIVTIY